MPSAPVPVRIHHMVHHATNAASTVILRSADDRQLVLHIGQFEWQAIQWGVCRVPFPRPLTHDLAHMLCKATNHQPDNLHIHKKSGGTYFGRLRLKTPATVDHKAIFVDCRPSDGLAMASRLKDMSIVVTEDLLEPCT